MPTWCQLGSQNPPKMEPSEVQKPSKRQSSKIIKIFKNHCFLHVIGGFEGPKLEPKSIKNRFKSLPSCIQNCIFFWMTFWIDFWWIFGRLLMPKACVHVCILITFWIDFWWIFGGCSSTTASKKLVFCASLCIHLVFRCQNLGFRHLKQCYRFVRKFSWLHFDNA